MGKLKVEEKNILEHILNGDSKDSIDYLYKKVFPQVKKFVMNRYGRADDAFDVFQDSIVELYELIIAGKFDKKYTVTGFLYRICSYKWLNKIKKEKALILEEDLSVLDGVHEEKAWYAIDWKNIDEDESVLSKYFAEIGDKCIQMLTLTILFDNSLDEVMHKMHFASIGAVKMQHMRCKEKMHKIIESNPKLLEHLRDRILHG